MTNKEKFKEIFGVESDDTSMILTCPHSIPTCKWYDDGCHCEDWWNAEYQEPTPKESLVIEDCISRADAIQAMQEKAKRLTNEDTINGLCGAVAILFDLPSVIPQEPKKGHWTHDGATVRCSNCERGYKDAFGRTSAITYNFCPNCGADMREVEE